MSELWTIVLPTYDEAENLPRLVPMLLALPGDPVVIVVDDASPDGTGALAEKLAREHAGRIEVIHRPSKSGLGTAYLAGFRRSFEHGSAKILTLDADLSHHPRHLGAMLERLEDADVVIGSRYVAGGRFVDSPPSRRILSRTSNALARAALGLRTRDVTGGFRLFRGEALAALPLQTIRATGYSFLVESLALAERSGLRVVEVPIAFEDRTGGASKLSRGEILRGATTLVRLAARRLRGRTLA